MAQSDTWFKIDESTPKNAFLLEKVKEHGSLRKLARKIGISYNFLSLALNKKKVSTNIKLKIAKFFQKDTIEIFN